MTAVSLDPTAGAQFAAEVDRTSADLSSLARRIASRSLPEMPASHRARVEVMRDRAVTGISSTSVESHHVTVDMRKRVILFLLADGYSDLAGAIGFPLAIVGGAANWWKNPKYSTRTGLKNSLWARSQGNGFLRRVSKFARGFNSYSKHAGSGAKTALLKSRHWMQKGSRYDAVMRSPLTKKIPIVGDALTATSVYADERGKHGSNHREATFATVGAVAGSRGGAVAGAATGALIGSVAGPPGALVGGVLGGIAGSELGQNIGRHGGKAISKLKFW